MKDMLKVVAAIGIITVSVTVRWAWDEIKRLWAPSDDYEWETDEWRNDEWWTA